MIPAILYNNLMRLKIMDRFRSFIWTERYCGFGDFELATIADSSVFEYLTLDNYISIPESDRLMIIEDIEIKPNSENENMVFVRGRSLESILDRRIVWGQKILTGDFQTAIETLLTENAISPTLTARQITKLTFETSTDPAITDLTIDAQFQGDNLYKVINDLCLSVNIGFKITLSDAGNFVFKLYSGVDRSYNQETNPYVVFSPNFDNLISSDYVASKRPMKTVTLVAGEGEGSTRMLVAAVGIYPEGSDLARREMFTDGSGISKTTDGGTLSDPEYAAELEQKGLEDLAKNTISVNFEGQAETNYNFVYGDHFFLGDTVQIINEYGLGTSSQVIELIRSEDVDGLKIYPTFVAIN